jgi:hypothetical protein
MMEGVFGVFEEGGRALQWLRMSRDGLHVDMDLRSSSVFFLLFAYIH